ncbi:MAG: hypothetical protein N2511_00195 [Thermodesulfovibrionales bacterium]|nr:hypothetical protein [Thermodesulfovibrionales bacterium]
MNVVKTEGLQTVSEATMGNIIKRHKLFFHRVGRIYHNPDSLWAKNSKRRGIKNITGRIFRQRSRYNLSKRLLAKHLQII